MSKYLSFVIAATFTLAPTAHAAVSQCTNQPTAVRAANPIVLMNRAPIVPFTVTPAQQYAAKLFEFLTGAPKSLLDPRFVTVTGLVEASNYLAAAQTVMADPGFLSVEVRQFAIPFIDPAHQPTDTLTDLQALIIGVTRDQLDARNLLTGNIRYSGYASLGLPPVSRSDNDHYAQFEANNYSFDTDLEQVTPQWDDLSYVSGALTTRAWAAAYYNAGTNRLGVKFSLDSFLCTPIDTWKIAGIPDSFVRRDVDRAQGGDPAAFQITCRNCHGAMDAMGGAFSKLDFTNAEFVFQQDGVVAKYNKNPFFYPAGFVSSDDSWVNLLSQHPTVDFGWRDVYQGTGLASLAKTLADSQAFSRCMVQKVFQSVCGQAIQSADATNYQPLADDFEKNGYNLKDLFAKVAIEDACIAHPTTPASAVAQ